jgi:hypothetical protein
MKVIPFLPYPHGCSRDSSFNQLGENLQKADLPCPLEGVPSGTLLWYWKNKAVSRFIWHVSVLLKDIYHTRQLLTKIVRAFPHHPVAQARRSWCLVCTVLHRR